MYEANLPTATKWLFDCVGSNTKKIITSVFMVINKTHGKKGTGFLFKKKYIITNTHVVITEDINQVEVISSLGEKLKINKIIKDEKKDLAVIELKEERGDKGLDIDENSEIKPGLMISTWGYPLGYNGPAPLLSVGYIAGFRENKTETSDSTKHIIVNGAFNPGNSGGPLLLSENNKVIGVVVSKHAPITPFLHSAIQALANNKSGVVFTARDEKGNVKEFVESQIVAELLIYFRSLTQVMIGEAIEREELIKFLKEKKIY